MINAMAVQMHFNKLCTRLAPQQLAINRARLHIQSVRTRLSASFPSSVVTPIGSVPRGTAIANASDVDLLARLPRTAATWGDGLVSSATFLSKVRADLEEHFPRTDTRPDGQAVTVFFGSGAEPVDVVPAIFESFKTEQRVPVFLIPDGVGGWLESAPGAHDNYLKNAVFAAGSKFQRTVQLMKAWRYSRTPTVPIRSIYLELFMGKTQICVGPKSLAQCMADTLFALHVRACKGVLDPTGLAGTMFATNSEASQQRLKDAIAYSAEHAASALDAQSDKNYAEAVRQWDIVFNGEFAV